MTHHPPYEVFEKEFRPTWSWNLPDDSWVGIWGTDWADALAIEIRKQNNSIKHEILQPDLRAQRIYQKEIHPGVIHKLYPARTRIKRIGLRRTLEIYSDTMIEYLLSTNTTESIYHIGQSVTSAINMQILLRLSNPKIVFSFHGETSLPLINLIKLQKNLFSKFYYLKEHIKSQKLFNKVSYVTYQSNKNYKFLNHYYKGPISKITMGIKFDMYGENNKDHARNELNLPKNKTILLTVCRLYDHKQVDKVIEVLSKIDHNFLYIVVGRGVQRYEDYLKRKAATLIKNNKIAFAGYKTGNELVSYYKAADLFIHASKGEAGPVVNMEAMACEIPVFCTKTGNTAEFLEQNNAGILVHPNNYREWEDKLLAFFENNHVKTVDLEIVKDTYCWDSIADSFLRIYKTINYEFK